MEQTPTQFWLTDVRYLEGKRAILAEFSHLSIKRMLRQPFFPSFFVSEKAIDFKTLKKVLSHNKRRVRLRQQGPAFKVSAATFSGLNQLAELLFRETGFRALVLKPERQFLLERQWSYFDCFTSPSEKEFLNNGLLSVPKAKLCLFSEPLHETVRQAAVLQPSLAEKILESLVLSNALRLPLCNVPNSRFLQQETLLQNLFWKTGLGVRGNLLAVKEMHWFCLQKESIVSKAVFSLNKRISLLEKKADEMSSCSLKQHGILGPGILSTNPDFLLQQAFLKATEGLLCSLPRHLCDGRSAFFNERLCFAIEAVEANVLNNFKRFAAKKKSRVVSLDKAKAFVLSDRPNSLIRQFSEKQTIPALIRASSWSK